MAHTRDVPSLRSTTGELIEFAHRLRVGRAEGNDLCIELGTVSSDHGVLEVRGDGLFVRDLGSTNGTRVKGRRVLSWTRLEVGDTVRFGPDSAWEVVADGGGGTVDSTVAAGTREQGYELSLRLHHDRPGEGRIELITTGGSVVFEGVPNRFVLLLVLARAALGREDAVEGWVDDERLRVAVWGRAGSSERYNSALGKVIYDTRRMISSKGIDPFFIEKSRGRTRLRLRPEHIHIEGD
jgi:hypothetical protein